MFSMIEMNYQMACIAILFFLLFSAFDVAQTVGLNWVIKSVEVPEKYSVIKSPSIALDSKDNPHISYCYDNDFLKYASWSGSSWNIQTIDGSALSPSLALDSKGYPHISYAKNNGLYYASWSGSSWNIQSVELSETSGYYRYSYLAIDSAGKPHISYSVLADHYYTNFTLKYASWNGSAWDIQILGQSEDRSSLALDSKGYPHITYGSDNGLKYASWNGFTWIVQVVDSGYESSLALDSFGKPCISYNYYYIEKNDPNATASDLRYASWNGSAWKIQIIEKYSSNTISSLALDSTWNPHICYFKGDNLKYASWTDNAWEIQTVSNEAQNDDSPSLALDSRGTPHISFTHYHSLIYASFAVNTVSINYTIITGVAVILVVIAFFLYYKRATIFKKWKGAIS
jgi:hypothetical protein